MLHRVEDALLDVVFGPALSVIHDRPSFDDIEGRILAIAIIVFGGRLWSLSWPSSQSEFQRSTVALSTLGFTSIWPAISSNEFPFLIQPLFIFGEIILAPASVIAFVVDDGDADRSEFSAFLIEDQIAGDARIILNVGIIKFQSAACRYPAAPVDTRP